MLRLIALVALALAAIQNEATPVSSVLRIKVSLVGADQRPVPLARHALLVSQNPASAAPRRVVTTPEGTAEIRLRPGNYTVESDRPTAFLERAYQWTQVVDVVAGRDTTLELTTANADVGPVTAEMAAEAAAAPAPTPVEEPLASALSEKRGSAVTVWTEHRRAEGFVVSGKDDLVETRESDIGTAMTVEVQLSPTEKFAGRVVSNDPAKDLAVVEIDRAVRLPVESSKPLPPETKAGAPAAGFSLLPYSTSSSDFDILFITPTLLASAESLQGRTGGATDSLSGLRAAIDFGGWSEYVSERPPVLFIRATPKLVESFWMKLARGAAITQGTVIPPIKQVGPGFSRMRLLCGGQEVTPVHPFRIRTRISETTAVDEGFYAFDPNAIGPQCGKVSLVLSSVKDPDKTETRVIDPAVISQVSKDFAAYRGQ